jgi:hypothetical protein
LLVILFLTLTAFNLIELVVAPRIRIVVAHF